MNWADYAILAVLALSVLVGLWRGLVAEVLALLIWVAAIWVAWTYGPQVATGFRHSIGEPSIRIILGYVLCFVAVLILGALIKFVMSRLVKGTGLSGSDRMLGMVFGLVRGVVLIALLVFLLGFTPFTRDSWWHQSRLLPTFISTADWLGEHVPDNVKRYVHMQGAAPSPDRGGNRALPDMAHALSAMSPGTQGVEDAGTTEASVATPASVPSGVAPQAHSRDN